MEEIDLWWESNQFCTHCGSPLDNEKQEPIPDDYEKYDRETGKKKLYFVKKCPNYSRSKNWKHTNIAKTRISYV